LKQPQLTNPLFLPLTPNSGGIGHFGILFAKALDAEVWAISRTTSKQADALAMGADGFLATSSSPDWATPHSMTFDMLLCTASADDGFDLSAYLSLLRVHGRFVSVGLPEGEGWRVRPMALLANGCLIGAAHLGSRKETLEMLGLAAEKGIRSWVETVPVGEKGVGEAREYFPLFNKFLSS
jgi:alcohol dehydrogenase (NADP+)